MSISKTIYIDDFSLTASPLEMFFNDTVLSTGTCFFWEHNKKRYLVTNWHNATGINPLTNQHLSKTLAQPNKVKIDVWKNQDLDTRGHALLFLEDENSGQPFWLEHPVHGRAIDVICLELPQGLFPHVFPVNTFNQGELITTVSDDVYILGYPMGIGVERLPIWKRASVASEPNFDVDNLPKILVDTATAKGMSGSPVIRRALGGLTTDGNYTLSTSPKTSFVGIYSGRLITGNSLEAQLGIVWKESVINEIIDGNKIGKI